MSSFYSFCYYVDSLFKRFHLFCDIYIEIFESIVCKFNYFGNCTSPVHSMLRHEYTHTEKRDKNVAEKAEATCLAAGHIEEGSTIFLGTGTTVEQMIPFLPVGCLRVITNSINVFNLLVPRESCELFLTGGAFRERTGAFVGPLAENAIALW